MNGYFNGLSCRWIAQSVIAGLIRYAYLEHALSLGKLLIRFENQSGYGHVLFILKDIYFQKRIAILVRFGIAERFFEFDAVRQGKFNINGVMRFSWGA